MKKFSIFAAIFISLTLIFGLPVANAENDVLKTQDEGIYKALATTDDKPELIPDEIVIQFKKGILGQKINEILSLFDLEKIKNSWKSNKFMVLKIPQNKLIQNVIKALGNLSEVLYVEQNAYAYALATPNDPYYSYQWHMTRIGMENAWDESTGSGVTVAIIDTGVKQSLEDLAQTNFVAGYDFVNNDSDPTDDEGHGSHVCGTVAQSTNNSVGVTGIAYSCNIMPIKVLNSQGSGSYTDIADGIYWATDNGAKIINLSLGGSSSNTTLQNAINYAWDNGVVIICAAGNSSSSSPFYPAAYSVCISVSATNSADGLANYSNYGSTIDICAPGGDQTDRDGDGYNDMILQNTFGSSGEGYYFYQGTSMASPHVAGVAALLLAIDPSLTNSEVREILETTAEDLGSSGWDQYFGHGIVDAYSACQEAGGGTPDTDPPVISNIQTTNITKNSATITWTTDEPSDSVVNYGLTTSYGSTESNSADVTSHSIELTGLSPNTLYHFKVASTDPSNNTAESGDNTFTTLEDTGEAEMYVFDISMQKENIWGWIYRASATITIKDTDGNVVPNATVNTTWSGKWSGTRNGTTDSNGRVTLTTSWTWGNGTFTCTVTDVTHATLNYNSALNNETSDSI